MEPTNSHNLMPSDNLDRKIHPNTDAQNNYLLTELPNHPETSLGHNQRCFNDLDMTQTSNPNSQLSSGSGATSVRGNNTNTSGYLSSLSSGHDTDRRTIINHANGMRPMNNHDNHLKSLKQMNYPSGHMNSMLNNNMGYRTNTHVNEAPTNHNYNLPDLQQIMHSNGASSTHNNSPVFPPGMSSNGPSINHLNNMPVFQPTMQSNWASINHNDLPDLQQMLFSNGASTNHNSNSPIFPPEMSSHGPSINHLRNMPVFQPTMQSNWASINHNDLPDLQQMLFSNGASTNHNSNSPIFPPGMYSNGASTNHNSNSSIFPPRMYSNGASTNHNSNSPIFPPGMSSNGAYTNHNCNSPIFPPGMSSNGFAINHLSNMPVFQTTMQHLNQASGSSNCNLPNFQEIMYSKEASSCQNNSLVFHPAMYLNRAFPSLSNEMSACPEVMPKLEKVEQVTNLIKRFPVTQVYGAPLVGKSTLVCQALEDLSEIELERKIKSIAICCKRLVTFADILQHLASQLQLKCLPNHFNAASLVHESLLRWNNHIVVVVFHKCETLREIDRAVFIKFLNDLNKFSKGTVKSVFTTYKQFVCLPSVVGETHIEMMDNSDIRKFLQFYLKRNLDIEEYIQLVIRNNLCFPLGVRRLVEVYIQNSGTRLEPDVLEMRIQKNAFQFFSVMLDDRVQEVESWVTVSRCRWISLFCCSHDVSSSEDLLREMSESDEYDDVELNFLKQNFAVVKVPGLDRLQFHPLVVFYYMLMMRQRRLSLEGMWFDISCSKVVKFLCQVLCLTEEITQCVGYKTAVIQCMVQEWPHMKNTIQWAIHCNNNTYRDFCKVALVGSHLLIKWFPVESVQFFQSLYEHAYHKGYDREAAVLQGLMAHAIFMGNGSTQKGRNWEVTEDHFKTALRILERDGPSFYLAQLLCLYARALNYQGKFGLSILYAEKGKAMMNCKFREEKEDHMSVTEGRVKDLHQRLDLGRAMPLIFTGRNDEAEKILLSSLEEKKKTGIDYSTLAQFLNLLGLIAQRGKNDNREALYYYTASLNERIGLEKFCPLDLVVPLNNIAMLYAELGFVERAKQMLEKAVDIHQKLKCRNYYTALTLLHLSEILFQSNELCQALDKVLKAKDILDEKCNKHDLRFHLQIHLAHIRMALDQEKENILAFKDGGCRSESLSSVNQIDYMSDLTKLTSAMCKSGSVERYLENVFQIGENFAADLSDNSHHFLLSALEHWILLDWGRRESMHFHIERMKYIFDTFPWLVNEMAKENSRNPRMLAHYEFYSKVKEVLNEDESRIICQFDSFLTSVLKSCKTCRMSSRYFNKAAWTTRFCHSCKKDKRCQCDSRDVDVVMPFCDGRQTQDTVDHAHNASSHKICQFKTPPSVLTVQRELSEEAEQSNIRADIFDTFSENQHSIQLPKKQEPFVLIPSLFPEPEKHHTYENIPCFEEDSNHTYANLHSECSNHTYTHCEYDTISEYDWHKEICQDQEEKSLKKGYPETILDLISVSNNSTSMSKLKDESELNQTPRDSGLSELENLIKQTWITNKSCCHSESGMKGSMMSEGNSNFHNFSLSNDSEIKSGAAKVSDIYEKDTSEAECLVPVESNDPTVLNELCDHDDRRHPIPNGGYPEIESGYASVKSENRRSSRNNCIKPVGQFVSHDSHDNGLGEDSFENLYASASNNTYMTSIPSNSDTLIDFFSNRQNESPRLDLTVDITQRCVGPETFHSLNNPITQEGEKRFDYDTSTGRNEPEEQDERELN